MLVMVEGYQLIEDESLLDALCRGYGSSGACSLNFDTLSASHMLAVTSIVKTSDCCSTE